MTIKEYIESGILESYVLGSASEAEARELLEFKKEHIEIQNALYELETDLERLARYMSIPPPPGIFTKIEDGINSLANTPRAELLVKEPGSQKQNNNFKTANNNGQFIEVEAESSYIRVHKTWKWIFAIVFALSKIFLIASIYYYLENRQAQQQIEQLKTELKQYPTGR